MDPTRFVTKRTLAHDGVWRVPVPFKVFVIGDPDAIVQIHGAHSKCYSRSKIVTDVIGSDLGDEGLFAVEDGELHQRLQRIMYPFFAPSKMGNMAELVADIWEPYLLSLRQAKGPVKSCELFTRFSIEVLMKYMFGQSATASEIKELSQLAPPVFKQMFIRVALSMLAPPLGVFFTRARRRLDRKVWELIRRPVAPDTEPQDLISQLKLAIDPETDERMTEKQIRDQVFTILMAGFDSAAVVWAWLMRDLAKDQTTLQELRQEVQTLCGLPTWGDVELLPKLQAKVMESTDRHMAFPMYFRGSSADNVILGKKIPRGSRLIISLDAMQQMLESQKAPHAPLLDGLSSYIPFGHGKRRCIGKFLAQVMIVIPLIRMLQEFDTWQIPAGYSDDDADYAMTRAPKGGAPLLFTPTLP